MAGKTARRQNGGASGESGDSPERSATVKVTVHLNVGTAQRLGIESAMRPVSQFAIAEEVLAAYLSRWQIPATFGSRQSNCAGHTVLVSALNEYVDRSAAGIKRLWRWRQPFWFRSSRHGTKKFQSLSISRRPGQQASPPQSSLLFGKSPQGLFLRDFAVRLDMVRWLHFSGKAGRPGTVENGHQTTKTRCCRSSKSPEKQALDGWPSGLRRQS